MPAYCLLSSIADAFCELPAGREKISKAYEDFRKENNMKLSEITEKIERLEARIKKLEEAQEENEKETCLQCGRKIDEEDIFWCEESEKAFCCEDCAHFYYRCRRVRK